MPKDSNKTEDFKFECASTGHAGADFLLGLFGCVAEAVINTGLERNRQAQQETSNDES